jgi:DNA uptake protein ComE-like DNA-binding protein
MNEKLAEVSARIDRSQEEKENNYGKKGTPVKPSPSIDEKSPTFDKMKEETTIRLLHILNRGNLKALKSLNTIGKKRSELIFQYREENGEFQNLNDLIKAGLKQSQIISLLKSNLDIA